MDIGEGKADAEIKGEVKQPGKSLIVKRSLIDIES